MRIRFLRVTPSANPDYPFLAGQIIELGELTSEAERWIEHGVAIVLPEGPEMAVMGGPSEVATEPRPRAKGRR